MEHLTGEPDPKRTMWEGCHTEYYRDTDVLH
jgi:hypothetical protein